MRAVLVCIEILIGIIAAVGIVLGIAFWRISSAPVAMGFMTPYLEQAFADSADGQTIEIGETQLIWEGEAKSVELRAQDLAVLDAEGRLVVALPAASLKLSLRALMQGTIAPTVIKVVGPRLRVVRKEDGSFDLGASFAEGVADAEAEDMSVALPRILDQLMAEPDPGVPLAFLRSVQILDAEFSIDDRRRNRVWIAPDANIELHRDKAGLAGEVDLEFGTYGSRAKFESSFLYDKERRSIDLEAFVENLNFPKLAGVMLELAPLQGLTPTLDGSIIATVGLDARIQNAVVAIQGGAGSFSLAGIIDDPLPLRSVSLLAQIDGSGQQVEITEASLELGTEETPGPTAALTGSMVSSEEGFIGDLTFEADAMVDKVSFDALETYWPAAIGAGARSWILENLETGVADSLSAKAAFLVPGGDFEALELTSLEGGIDFQNLDIHFLRPLPPIRGVSGKAVFDQSRFDISAGGGKLGDLSAEDAKIVISNLDKADKAKKIYERMTIDVRVAGPAPEALSILNHKRLDLLSGLGISPDGSGGQAQMQMAFQFPLLANLKFDHINLQVTGDIQDAVVGNLLFGQDATDGQMHMELTQDGMRLTGPLRLGGIPLEADWTENFTDKSPERSQIQAQVPEIDDAGRSLLGIDLGERLVGPVSADIFYSSWRDGGGRVEADIDMTRARFAEPSILWAKEPGLPGQAKVAVELLDNRIVEYSQIDISAEGFAARGRGRPGPDGKGLASLAADEFTFGTSRLTGVTLEQRDAGYDITVAGGILDATHFLGNPSGDAATVAAPITAGEGPRTPFTLRAPQLAFVLFGDGRSLQDVALELDQTAAGWRVIQIAGKVPRPFWFARKSDEALEGASFDERRVMINFRPDGGGGQSLMASSNDMGAALRALNLRDTINGGRVRVTGSSAGPLPHNVISGRVEVDDFVVVKAPGMARLFAAASFGGLSELLGSDGLTFTRLFGDFTLNDGLAESDLIRMHGDGLGLTAKGSVNFDAEMADLQGTIVPAYGINSVLGQIPILGDILTGGEGEGVLAVTYSMTGPLSDPKVSVNPLSFLAPGFLRGLFSGSAGDGAVMAVPRGPDK